MRVGASAPDRRPARLELAITLAAAGAIALHVLTDGLVAPEPGTAGRDHLISILVPVAVVATAVLTVRRARPGARAAIALVLGALALVGGSVALAGATAGGVDGDEWTGLVLLPAGLALVLTGAVTLITSRSRRGCWVLRRALVAAGAVVVAYELVLPVGVAIVSTHRPREVAAPGLLGVPHRTVEIATTDGLTLAGSYVPSRNGAAVLAFPGRRSPLAHAQMLVRHGYGVLLVDMRGQGESEGDPNTFGWDAARDVDAAIDFLRRQPDVDPARVGGLGLSVGGEALIEAAAGNVHIRAVVSEGAGERSVRESALRGVAGWPSLPLAAVLTAATAVLGNTTPPLSLETLVRRIAPRPLLLVHAGHGQGGEDLNPRYFVAARAPKELWTIPEASHVGGIEARPSEYERRVVGFLDRSLAADG